jgi:hypothetical protein
MPVISIDAPVSGWNAYDSLDAMPPDAAVILNNIIPGAGEVETRKGYIVFEDLGTGEPVETLASFNPADMSQLIAASDGGLWELSDSGAEAQAQSLTPIEPAGTFANSRWQTENFRKADEAGIMVMCNGADPVQIYNGTTVTPIDATGTLPALWDAATNYVIGDEVQHPFGTSWEASADSLNETPSGGSAFWDSIEQDFTPDFIGAVAFKGRMYYWKDDDNAFWYTQAGSYQGEFQKFDLGTFVQQGGKIVTVFSWTQQDSGHGRDDFIVFVFSTGEILVYQGDDPQTAGYWEQVGRYFTAEPLSIRGVTNYGADSILMTKDGYVSMTSIIQEGRTSDVPQFSRLIHRAVVRRTRNSLDLFGWDVELFPRDGLMIFNVPLSDQTFEQHVMNTVTQKWCRFKGFDIRCMEVHNERLFGGLGDGTVIAMLETTSDNSTQIVYDCLYAFNYLSDPGYQKHVTACQVLSTHSNPVEINLSAWADGKIPTLSPIGLPAALDKATWSILPTTPPAAIGSFWDQDYWASGEPDFTTTGWQNVSAVGYAVAILVRFAKVNEPVIWRSTSIRFHQIGAQ